MCVRERERDAQAHIVILKMLPFFSKDQYLALDPITSFLWSSIKSRECIICFSCNSLILRLETHSSLLNSSISSNQSQH